MQCGHRPFVLGSNAQLLRSRNRRPAAVYYFRADIRKRFPGTGLRNEHLPLAMRSSSRRAQQEVSDELSNGTMVSAKDVIVEVDASGADPPQLQKQVRLRVAQLTGGQMKGIFALHAFGSIISVALTVATVVLLQREASIPRPHRSPTHPPTHPPLLCTCIESAQS